jgi:hypothetical protein
MRGVPQSVAKRTIGLGSAPINSATISERTMVNPQASGLQIEILPLCSNWSMVTVNVVGADRFPYTVVTPGYSCAELEEWFYRLHPGVRDYFVFVGSMSCGATEVYSRYKVANRSHALYAQVVFGNNVPLDMIKRLNY